MMSSEHGFLVIAIFFVLAFVEVMVTFVLTLMSLVHVMASFVNTLVDVMASFMDVNMTFMKVMVTFKFFMMSYEFAMDTMSLIIFIKVFEVFVIVVTFLALEIVDVDVLVVEIGEIQVPGVERSVQWETHGFAIVQHFSEHREVVGGEFGVINGADVEEEFVLDATDGTSGEKKTIWESEESVGVGQWFVAFDRLQHFPVVRVTG